METNAHGQPLGTPVGDWRVPRAPGRMTLRGADVTLVPTIEDHAEGLFAAWDDPAGFTYLPYGPWDDVDALRDWVSEMSRHADPLFFTLMDAQGPAGVASFLRIAPAAGSIEVGHINFGPRLRRTPAATEAMFLMMRWAFEAGYRRYEWKCDALNAPSRAAAARLGLTFEGIFRQAVVVKGRNRDTAWFAATDTEWPRLRAAFEAWLDPENLAGGSQVRRLSDLTRTALEGA